MGDMWRLFRSEKPDALFAYTIKSVVYGCVIARLAGIRVCMPCCPAWASPSSNR
jgi:hypothetical protein